ELAQAPGIGQDVGKLVAEQLPFPVGQGQPGQLGHVIYFGKGQFHAGHYSIIWRGRQEVDWRGRCGAVARGKEWCYNAQQEQLMSNWTSNARDLEVTMRELQKENEQLRDGYMSL